MAYETKYNDIFGQKLFVMIEQKENWHKFRPDNNGFICMED